MLEEAYGVRVGFKSSQGVCSELTWTESYFIWKDAHCLHTDCAELVQLQALNKQESRVGMA